MDLNLSFLIKSIPQNIQKAGIMNRMIIASILSVSVLATLAAPLSDGIGSRIANAKRMMPHPMMQRPLNPLEYIPIMVILDHTFDYAGCNPAQIQIVTQAIIEANQQVKAIIDAYTNNDPRIDSSIHKAFLGDIRFFYIFTTANVFS